MAMDGIQFLGDKMEKLTYKQFSCGYVERSIVHKRERLISMDHGVYKVIIRDNDGMILHKGFYRTVTMARGIKLKIEQRTDV